MGINATIKHRVYKWIGTQAPGLVSLMVVHHEMAHAQA